MIKIELKLDPKKDKRRINQFMWNALAIVSLFKHSPNSLVKCTKTCFPTATTNSSGGSGQKNGQIHRKWRPCKEVHVIQAANGWTHYRIWSKWNYWKRATERQAGGQADRHRAIEKKIPKAVWDGKMRFDTQFFWFLVGGRDVNRYTNMLFYLWMSSYVHGYIHRCDCYELNFVQFSQFSSVSSLQFNVERCFLSRPFNWDEDFDFSLETPNQHTQYIVAYMLNTQMCLLFILLLLFQNKSHTHTHTRH